MQERRFGFAPLLQPRSGLELCNASQEAGGLLSAADPRLRIRLARTASFIALIYEAAHPRRHPKRRRRPMPRLRSTFRARIWVAVAAGSIAALVIAPSALAHAGLDSSTPSNDEVLRRAPEQVVLTFSEPVETAFGSVRVYDGAARRVDDGRTTRPDRDAVAVRLAVGSRSGHLHRRVADRVRGLASGQRRVRLSHRKAWCGCCRRGWPGSRRARRLADRRTCVLARPLPELDAHRALRRWGGCPRLGTGWGVRRGAQVAVDPPRIPRERARRGSRWRVSGSKAHRQAGWGSMQPCVDP